MAQGTPEIPVEPKGGQRATTATASRRAGGRATADMPPSAGPPPSASPARFVRTAADACNMLNRPRVRVQAHVQIILTRPPCYPPDHPRPPVSLSALPKVRGPPCYAARLAPYSASRNTHAGKNATTAAQAPERRATNVTREEPEKLAWSALEDHRGSGREGTTDAQRRVREVRVQHIVQALRTHEPKLPGSGGTKTTNVLFVLLLL